MEKLIELLNEYEKKRIEKINSEGKLILKLTFRPYTIEALTNKAYQSVRGEITSKYYGFVARLVENNKINSNIGVNNYNGRDISFRREIVSKKHENIIKTHTTLMILSIQDNPLKFLVSLLK